MKGRFLKNVDSSNKCKISFFPVPLGQNKYAFPEGPKDSFGGSLWGGQSKYALGKDKYALPEGIPLGREE